MREQSKQVGKKFVIFKLVWYKMKKSI